ncbi:hypothetical protein NST11_15965 [Caldifermentibacillus hisashii]|uniref:hypothetical protein n=1 Tax=Caldifermentibacillus hisashii TaxID=996558 RepID=UPI0031B7B4FC
MATRPFLVVILSQKMLIFGDEAFSRRHFEPKNFTFWRRNPFSSSFFGRKLHFLATKPILVVTLSRKMLIFGDEALSRRHFEPKNSFFGDETLSRHLFEAENALFWRRDPFSSSFFGRKLHFLATRFILATILSRKTPFFGDETLSRRHFEPKNAYF